MPYAVAVCPACRKARVVEAGRRTAACAHCARTLRVAEARAVPAASFEDAQRLAGALNARAAGREDEFAGALAAEAARAPPPERHEDRRDRAAARARGVAGGEAARVEAVARALTEEGEGPWGGDDLAAALALAGLAGADPARHLDRLLRSGAVLEVRAGRYRAV